MITIYIKYDTIYYMVKIILNILNKFTYHLILLSFNNILLINFKFQNIKNLLNNMVINILNINRFFYINIFN